MPSGWSRPLHLRCGRIFISSSSSSSSSTFSKVSGWWNMHWKGVFPSPLYQGQKILTSWIAWSRTWCTREKMWMRCSKCCLDGTVSSCCTFFWRKCGCFFSRWDATRFYICVYWCRILPVETPNRSWPWCLLYSVVSTIFLWLSNPKKRSTEISEVWWGKWVCNWQCENRSYIS